MDFNLKDIIYILIALLIGLGAGYLIFGKPIQGLTTEHAHVHTSNSQIESDQIWTCSMDPQIRQNEPGSCPICGMDLILLKSNGSNNPLVLEMTREAVQLANIQTSIIGSTKFDANNSISVSGKIQPDERQAFSQVAHVPGRIEQLYVSFTGEMVNKGQKIATIYAPELITAQQELLAALKLKDLKPDLVQAARKKLKNWKISEKVIEQIEQEGTIRNDFTVYAESSGIVYRRRVAVGDYVNQGSTLFDLMNLNKLWVFFDIYERDLPRINLGDHIEFTSPAFPGNTFYSKINFIDPVIDPETRVVSIRAEVENSRKLLKPEMLVYGKVITSGKKSGVLTVPKSAVMWTGPRSVVYIKIQGRQIPSFEFREVEIGQSIGESYEVLNGLKVGEEVVTNGSFTIDAAAQLNNQASMMNRKVKVKGKENSLELPDFTQSTNPDFKHQLFDLATDYLMLKNALVASDPLSTRKAAEPFLKTLSNVDKNLIDGVAQQFWMDQLKGLQVHSEKIAATKDLEEQREQFDFLSKVLIQAIKTFGIDNDTLYVQYCPMAFDNIGASWLSDLKEIRNPYFGDQMLTCGLVKATIDETFRNESSEKLE